PDTEAELGNLDALLKEILNDVGSLGDAGPSPVRASEEANKIMEEATDTADRKLRERFPPLPASLLKNTDMEQIDY
ncbi:MAG: hypothetical protein V3U25_02135, partial [Nitrososphaerales archaeon]